MGSRRDARWLVEVVSGTDGAELTEILGERAPERAVARLESMIERRRRGEPLQYVAGAWGFRHLDLMVDERVLIPRPETEVVVEVALAELLRLRAQRGHRRPLVVVDLGTGSGAIALSLALEAPPVTGPVQVWATDASAAALEVASANLAGLAGVAATQVHLARGDWWDALPSKLAGRVDLVVSNPPYVAEADEVEAEVSAWEPTAALWSGPTGLEDTARILAGAGAWLHPTASVVVEIAAQRAVESMVLAKTHGFEAEVLPDLAGRDRVLIARTSPPRTAP
ncbi:MAG: peptide chain release factor N(5)-glutamine methyltransferase [Acidimicrobiales bacterium]